MKKTFTLFLSLAAISLVACTNESLPYKINEPVIKVENKQIWQKQGIPKDIDEISKDNAATVAKIYCENIHGTKSDIQKQIKNVVAINDESGKPAMYAVNFNDGFIWVSATKKTYPILAEVEHGCYTSADSETGMDILRDDMVRYIQALKDGDITKNEDTSRDVMLSWKKYELQDNDEVIRTKFSDAYYDALDELYAMAYREGYEIYRMIEAEEREVPSNIVDQLVGSATSDDNIFGDEYDPKYTAYILEKYHDECVTYGPYVKTQWGQDSPFNSADPLNRELGCVTIAVGQFMKYYQKPDVYTIGNESYSWNDMPLNTSNATLSTFLYDLRKNLNITSGGSGSITDARKFLNKFNYAIYR